MPFLEWRGEGEKETRAPLLLSPVYTGHLLVFMQLCETARG